MIFFKKPFKLLENIKFLCCSCCTRLRVYSWLWLENTGFSVVLNELQLKLMVTAYKGNVIDTLMVSGYPSMSQFTGSCVHYWPCWSGGRTWMLQCWRERHLCPSTCGLPASHHQWPKSPCWSAHQLQVYNWIPGTRNIADHLKIKTLRITQGTSRYVKLFA